MTLSHKTTHVAEAIGRFTEQFKNKPNLTALVSAFVERNQGVEDIVWEVYEARQLANATDVRLDDIGAIVGQPRDGRVDYIYRQWISARIVINRSNGTADDTLHVLGLIVPDYDPSLYEYYPAAYVVRLYDYPGDFDAIFDILRQIKPAGVRLFFEYSEYPTSELFTLSESLTVVSDDLLGLGDATDPGVGGRLAGVLSA